MQLGKCFWTTIWKVVISGMEFEVFETQPLIYMLTRLWNVNLGDDISLQSQRSAKKGPVK